MPPEDWLRLLSDAELDAVVAEVEERQDFFDSKVRQQINDECRRRRKRTIKERQW